MMTAVEKTDASSGENNTPVRQRIKISGVRDYAIASLAGFFVFALLSAYLFLRRDDFNLYIANKAVAGTGAALIALVFLVGSLARYFDRYDRWIGYRKEIGIIGVVFVIAHVIISAVLLPKKFMASYFADERLAMIAGIAGIVILVVLWALSRNAMIVRCGGALWWLLQRWGLRAVVFFTVLHVVPLKYPGWEKWIMRGGTSDLAMPWLPPASLLVSIFLFWVIAVRLFEMIFFFKSIGFIATREITDPSARSRGRKFMLISGIISLLFTAWLFLRWTTV